jgi:hypothetical protein
LPFSHSITCFIALFVKTEIPPESDIKELVVNFCYILVPYSFKLSPGIHTVQSIINFFLSNTICVYDNKLDKNLHSLQLREDSGGTEAQGIFLPRF